MLNHNVDIRLADLPIAHRFAAWALTQQLPLTNRETLGALADCRSVRICACGGLECASMHLTRPDPSLLKLPAGLTYWNTTAGLVGLSIDREYMEIEGLAVSEDDQHFPHREEIHRALSNGCSPTRNLPVRKARKIFMEWLAGLEERELVQLEVDSAS